MDNNSIFIRNKFNIFNINNNKHKQIFKIIESIFKNLIKKKILNDDIIKIILYYYLLFDIAIPLNNVINSIDKYEIDITDSFDQLISILDNNIKLSQYYLNNYKNTYIFNNCFFGDIFKITLLNNINIYFNNYQKVKFIQLTKNKKEYYCRLCKKNKKFNKLSLRKHINNKNHIQNIILAYILS